MTRVLVLVFVFAWWVLVFLPAGGPLTGLVG